MISAKQQLIQSTRRATLLGGILGTIALVPYVHPIIMVMIGGIYAAVFRFVFRGLIENVLYTTPDFYNFMRKLKWEQGLPKIWNPIIARRQRRSLRLIVLLVLLLTFPVALLFKWGIFPIIPGTILIGTFLYARRLYRVQKTQSTFLIKRAETFENQVNENQLKKA